MITDAQILTIARELYAAEQALKDAKAARDELVRKLDMATKLAEERTATVQRVQARLLQLAKEKPAEPPPKPAQPIWAAEPPKSMADHMTGPPSDADAPPKDKAELVRESRLKESAAKMPSSAGPVPTLNAKRK